MWQCERSTHLLDKADFLWLVLIVLTYILTWWFGQLRLFHVVIHSRGNDCPRGGRCTDSCADTSTPCDNTHVLSKVLLCMRVSSYKSSPRTNSSRPRIGPSVVCKRSGRPLECRDVDIFSVCVDISVQCDGMRNGTRPRWQVTTYIPPVGKLALWLGHPSAMEGNTEWNG